MENNGDLTSDKKFINRAKSHNNTMKLKSEPAAAKRKSFNVNEAVRSLDLALGRLKKSKLVNDTSSRQLSPSAHGAPDMFVDMCATSSFHPGMDNASLMSMNFSQYELVRNVSCSNCFSDGAYSGNTACSARLNPADLNDKDEHLERYFRSVEMWSRTFSDSAPSTLYLELPDKAQ